jgi:protease I
MISIKRTITTALGLAALLTAMGPASASNLAVDADTSVTPHQELMSFLLRGPADPNRFAGKRVAMIVVNGGDAVTLQMARDYLVEQGATVDVLTPRGEADARFRGVRAADSLVSTRDYAGNERSTEATFLDETDPRSYQVIYLPGNHPDTQGIDGNPEIAQYAAKAASAGKAIFAMGDSALILARGNLLRGRHATGSRTLQPFLVWAGVEVYDEAVVRDSLIYTSRDAFDLPRLMSVMTQVLTTP